MIHFYQNLQLQVRYFNMATSQCRRRTTEQPEAQAQQTNQLIAGISKNVWKAQHTVPVYLKPSNTDYVHLKDWTPNHRRSSSEVCSELFTGETKQPLHNRMVQHRQSNTSGPVSAVYLHLEDRGHLSITMVTRR